MGPYAILMMKPSQKKGSISPSFPPNIVENLYSAESPLVEESRKYMHEPNDLGD